MREYLDAQTNQADADPYAYPAYDTFNADDNEPHRISDADLLAPLLLNVKVSLRSFYALQRARGGLERALARVDLNCSSPRRTVPRSKQRFGRYTRRSTMSVRVHLVFSRPPCPRFFTANDRSSLCCTIDG